MPISSPPFANKAFKIIPSCLLAVGLQMLSAGAQELLTNGGFETGGLLDGGNGWTKTPGYGEVVSFTAHDGSFSYSSDSTMLRQTIASSPGLGYDISFWLANPYGDDQCSFIVKWGGATVYSLDPAPGDPDLSFNWRQVSIPNQLASGSSTVLEFTFYNPPDFYYLDSVSVTAAPVPEPETYALGVGLGLAGFAAFRRFRRS